jgi:hypothetical protein
MDFSDSPTALAGIGLLRFENSLKKGFKKERKKICG